MDYVLLDLERTIKSGTPCFWKYNRHGYTYVVEHSGLFSKELAERIVADDLDNKTVMISVKLIEELLATTLKAHEGV